MKKAVLLGLFLAGCGYHTTRTVNVDNTTVVVVVDDDDSDSGSSVDAGQTESAPTDAGAPVVLDAGVPDAGHGDCDGRHERELHCHDDD